MMTADEKAADDLANEIVDHFHHFALAIARRYATPFPWLLDDLQSDALLSLLRVARKHVARQTAYPYLKGVIGVAISRVCNRRIDRECATNQAAFRHAPEIRHGSKRYRAVVYVADRRCHEDEVDDRDQHEAEMQFALRLLNQLAADRAEVILRAVCEGASLPELAREYGVALSTVSVRVWRAIREMRQRGGIEVAKKVRGKEEQLKSLIGVSEATRERIGNAAKRRGAARVA